MTQLSTAVSSYAPMPYGSAMTRATGVHSTMVRMTRSDRRARRLMYPCFVLTRDSSGVRVFLVGVVSVVPIVSNQWSKSRQP
jgi:hypothetical protein